MSVYDDDLAAMLADAPGEHFTLTCGASARVPVLSEEYDASSDPSGYAMSRQEGRVREVRLAHATLPAGVTLDATVTLRNEATLEETSYKVRDMERVAGGMTTLYLGEPR